MRFLYLYQLNSLAEKFSKEWSQNEKKEVDNDQAVQSLPHHGLPTLTENTS